MLKIEEIHSYYGNTPALFGVSLQVEAGQVVSLIGANGAGKSTTLKSISGLLHPRSGSIVFLGQEISKKQPNEILRLGIAHSPEGRRVWPMMTVMENLEMGGYIQRKADRRTEIDRMFEHFPILGERRWQKAGSLSGGEQTMLAIARAMMAKPKLLLLDEPSLGLSPLMVDKVGEIIKSLNREEHVSILLVEQNANLAMSVAQYVYVMENGKVVVGGTSEELRHNDFVQKAYFGEGQSLANKEKGQ